MQTVRMSPAGPEVANYIPSNGTAYCPASAQCGASPSVYRDWRLAMHRHGGVRSHDPDISRYVNCCHAGPFEPHRKRPGGRPDAPEERGPMRQFNRHELLPRRDRMCCHRASGNGERPPRDNGPGYVSNPDVRKAADRLGNRARTPPSEGIASAAIPRRFASRAVRGDVSCHFRCRFRRR